MAALRGWLAPSLACLLPEMVDIVAGYFAVDGDWTISFGARFAIGQLAPATAKEGGGVRERIAAPGAFGGWVETEMAGVAQLYAPSEWQRRSLRRSLGDEERFAALSAACYAVIAVRPIPDTTWREPPNMGDSGHLADDAVVRAPWIGHTDTRRLPLEIVGLLCQCAVELRTSLDWPKTAGDYLTRMHCVDDSGPRNPSGRPRGRFGTMQFETRRDGAGQAEPDRARLVEIALYVGPRCLICTRFQTVLLPHEPPWQRPPPPEMPIIRPL
jgi:hypothetical protein